MQQTTLQALQTCTETKQAFNQLARLEQHLSIKKSIENAPLISQETSKLETIRQIIHIVEFFLKVTGKELEPFQIQILAGDLYEKFRCDTLDDIVLMFKLARQGDFGKVYRCDTLEIMDWANRYLIIKAEEREKLIYAKKAEPKALPNPKDKYFHELSPEIQEQFKRFKTFKTQKMLTPRITDYLTEQKHRDQISKALENDTPNP